jgi:hypothetical protein
MKFLSTEQIRIKMRKNPDGTKRGARIELDLCILARTCCWTRMRARLACAWVRGRITGFIRLFTFSRQFLCCLLTGGSILVGTD